MTRMGFFYGRPRDVGSSLHVLRVHTKEEKKGSVSFFFRITRQAARDSLSVAV